MREFLKKLPLGIIGASAGLDTGGAIFMRTKPTKTIYDRRQDQAATAIQQAILNNEIYREGLLLAVTSPSKDVQLANFFSNSSNPNPEAVKVLLSGGVIIDEDF